MIELKDILAAKIMCERLERPLPAFIIMHSKDADAWIRKAWEEQLAYDLRARKLLPDPYSDVERATILHGLVVRRDDYLGDDILFVLVSKNGNILHVQKRAGNDVG